MNFFRMPLISAGLGRRKPNPHGIRQPSRRQMLIAKHLTLFFVVCLQMSFIGFLTLPLPRRLGRYWRPLMREGRK